MIDQVLWLSILDLEAKIQSKRIDTIGLTCLVCVGQILPETLLFLVYFKTLRTCILLFAKYILTITDLHQILLSFIMSYFLTVSDLFIQLAVVVEYTDCVSVEG